MEILLSQVEAAKHLGKAEGTLEQWRHAKRGPCYLKVGGSVRYRLSDLEAYLATCVVKPVARVAA